MLDVRTAWAIALLLAPTGAAVAGATGMVQATAQHTAYVQIMMQDRSAHEEGLVAIEARVACQTDGALQEAVNWLRGSGCTGPPGAAVYITEADHEAPDPSMLSPTGIVYVYEDGDRSWHVDEYTYPSVPAGEERYAYVLTPDISQRVDDEGPGTAVRGVVNLETMGVAMGSSIDLEATLGPGPTSVPEDPTLRHVDAGQIPTAPGVSGTHTEASLLTHTHR